MTEPADVRRLRFRGFMHGLIPVILMGIILFAGAGTILWPAAWMILGIQCTGTLITVVFCYPDLLQERIRVPAGAKEFDKKMVRAMSITGLLSMLVAGLDFRFGWTGPVDFLIVAAAVSVLLSGFILLWWAFIENRFFSLIVRIQKDKGHYPVATGPYRFMRHPGYLGLILIILAQPIALGSLWALIPAIAAAAVLIKRTDMEDGTLILELEGYEDYTWNVKYRLVPGIW